MSKLVLLLALFVALSAAWNLDFHDRYNGPTGWPAACSTANTASPIDIKQAQFSTRFDPFNLISGGYGKCNFQLTASRRIECVPAADIPITFIADQPSVLDTEKRPNLISGLVKKLEIRYPSSHTFNGGNYAVELIASIDQQQGNPLVVTNKYQISFLFRESTNPDLKNPAFEWFNHALDVKLGNYGDAPYNIADNAGANGYCQTTALFPMRIGKMGNLQGAGDLNTNEAQAFTACGATANSCGGLNVGGGIPAASTLGRGQCAAVSVDFDLRSLFAPNMHYYIYDGRDDLPPCSSTRRIIIMKNLYEIGGSQYQKLIDFAMVRSTYYSVWLNVHPTDDRDAPTTLDADGQRYQYKAGNWEARPAPLRMPSWPWYGGQAIRHNDVSANGDYYRYSRDQNSADNLIPVADGVNEGAGSGAILSPPVKPTGERIIWSSDPEEIGSTSSNVAINQRSMMYIRQ